MSQPTLRDSHTPEAALRQDTPTSEGALRQDADPADGTLRQTAPGQARMPFPPAPAQTDTAEHAAEAQPSMRVGDLLEGRYQIEEQIGAGGVGVVYRALQLKLHRHVAVKLLLQDTIGEEAIRPRFQQEALTLAAVSHPNIVSLQDYGMVRGRPFLVMEYLEGRTLREMVDSDGPLAPLRALTLLRQLVLALAYAHGLGVVHRDLKPANLIVLSLPSYEHVKVLDFGMIKLLPHSVLTRGESLTRAGYTFGTPAYMSPEHAIGGDVDGRSDLYAVGVLLFELLTGEKPYDGEVQDVLRDHLQSPIPRLSERRAELGEQPLLQALIDRAMAKEPVDRYAHASELLVAIDALIGVLQPAAQPRTSSAPAQAEPAGASLHPKLRETLDSAAAAWSSYARVSRKAWREHASPRLLRARGELRVAGAQLVPRLRSLSRSTWQALRPQLLRAGQGVLRLASETRLRIAQEAQNRRDRATRHRGRSEPPRALPAGIPEDATWVDPVEARPRTREPKTDEDAELTTPLRVPAEKAYTGTIMQFGGQAGATAEPLVLEPRSREKTDSSDPHDRTRKPPER